MIIVARRNECNRAFVIASVGIRMETGVELRRSRKRYCEKQRDD